MDDRSLIFKRLKQDIFGPRLGVLEKIDEKPSSRYLTGILFPQGTTISQEEDDEIDQPEGDDDAIGGIEEKVSLFASLRPSTAGFSFAVRDDHGGGGIKIGVFCAKYSHEDVEVQKDRSTKEADPAGNAVIPSDQDSDPDGIAAGSGSVSSRHKRVWQRQPINIRFDFLLEKGDGNVVNEEIGLECVWKIRRSGGVYLVTVQFVNCAVEKNLTGTDREEETLFQFRASAVCTGAASFAPRPQLVKGRDEDQKIADLIYREIHEYAVGHTASAHWKTSLSAPPRSVQLTWLPKAVVKQMDSRGDPVFQEHLAKAGGSLDALALAHGESGFIRRSVIGICDAYDEWINKQAEAAEIITEPSLRAQASRNLDACRDALKRMREGAHLASSEGSEIMSAFRLANWAMYIQFAWSKGAKDAVSHRPGNPKAQEFAWRPFQLAFVLMCLGSSTDEEHLDRKVFDLIWFPTGGGKTEAYLFLAACTLFFRRLKFGVEGAGVGALMRYTLRTLTVQQFERAAALITACEVIRRTEGGYGSHPFSIGLWVGAGSTPNKFEDAKEVINDPDANSTPRQLTHCPICLSNNLVWVAEEDAEEIKCFCSDADCIGELPIMTVDTDIYRTPPSLLIGTVDKFAQIVRNRKTRALFGIGTHNRSPDLIIQDELHLISGPLGSMAGLYETAIDSLCSSGGKPPKIVGSTATIRRASEQIKCIFDRDAFQFPPPAINWDNSCFAKLSDDDPGRLYVGVTTAGRSEKFSLQGVTASLLQSGYIAPGDTDEPYKTLVAYFNSLKTLGGAMVLMEDDALMTLNSISKSRGEDGRKNIRTPEELTSRKSSREIPQILNWLKALSSAPEFIDILLASNMLSVGVDIPRLGLMLMAGQPKSMSEYIQATSRVGRSYPGLIVTLYNNSKIRDRAHFEAFQSWHGALYRAVEPGSVTPFAPRARDKALHAPLVALAMLRDNIQVGNKNEARLREIAEEILGRIRRIDSAEAVAASEELGEFISNWCDLAASGQLKEYWNDKKFRTSLLMSAEEAAARRATGSDEILAQPTPNSLRNVEPGVTFEIKESARTFSEYKGESTSAEGEIAT